MVRRFLVFLFYVLLSAEASAHRELESLTTITRNPRSALIEVVHRIHQHDAQAVLTKLSNVEKEAKDIGTVRGQAHIALLVEQAFKVQNHNQPVDLKLVGATLDNDFVLIFQEFAQPSEKTLTIQFSLFDDIFTNYVSRLTLLIGQVKRTVFFDSNHLVHEVVIPAPVPQQS